MISRFNGLIYNNIHKGKKGFVIGTGPSINKIEKSYINKLQKEITVGINHAYVLFNPTYLLWSDSFFWNHFNKDLINVNSIKLCPSELVLNGKIVMVV